MTFQSNGPRESTVAPDGSGDFRTLQEAIAAAPTGTREHPSVVHVRPGTYHELLYVQREKRFLRILGDDPATTVVTCRLSSAAPGPDGRPIGTFRTAVATFDADDLTVENLSFTNGAGAEDKGPALAARVDGDRITFRNCRFTGRQDTLLDNRGRHFYQQCTITGATDFIFGGGTGFFEGCRIVCAGNGYITAPSTPDDQKHGFTFSHCVVTGTTPDVRTFLGRPWRDHGMTAFTNCDLGSVVRPEGWSDWDDRKKTARFAEYRCFGPGADTKARVPWARKLTADEGDLLTAERVLAGTEGWKPRAGYAFGATVTANVSYGEAGGERLLLDASSPDGTGPFPVVILVHGGGWGGGDKQGDLAPLLQPALSRRFVWFTIDYRLAPRHVWPACQEDVATAICWVKANAARFKGDPDRIALIGYSAGGQLAARAAVANALDTRVQAVVGFAAPTDLTADTARRGGLSTSLMPLFGHTAPEVDDDARTKLRQMSAINHIPAAGEGTLPPFLLVHGTADRSVLFDQSVTFQNALRAAGTSAELISLREAPHAIAQWERIDPSYRDAVVAWLETQLTARK